MTAGHDCSSSTIPDWDDLIILGTITRTQGHRGAVRMFPEFEPAANLENLKTDEVILKMAASKSAGVGGTSGVPFRRILHIAEFSYHQQFIVMQFREIPDMNAAETLRGAIVYVRPEHLWDLESGQYFSYELKGFIVVELESGRELGTVADIDSGSAHDFLKVKSAAERTFLIPFTKAMVPEIDRGQRRILVSIPPGLEEL